MLRLGLSKVAGAVLLQLQLLCRATSSLQKHWLEGGGSTVRCFLASRSMAMVDFCPPKAMEAFHCAHF